MATDAQIHANLQNSQHSTGPRTDEGKRVASRNSATRGGVSGEGKTLSDIQLELVLAHTEALTQGFPPKDHYDLELIDQAATAHVLMNECDARLTGLAEADSDMAKVGWNNRRELEAIELAKNLGRHPATTARKLQETRQGCQVMIETWLFLKKKLQDQGRWTPEQHNKGLDLLGVSAEARQGGPSELDDPARALAIIERELARLRELADSPELKAACENARLRTIQGRQPLNSRDARLLLRYRSQHARRYQWCVNELRRRRAERERERRRQAPEPKSTTSADRPATGSPSETVPPDSIQPQPVLSNRQRKVMERMRKEEEQRQRWGSTHRSR